MDITFTVCTSCRIIFSSHCCMWWLIPSSAASIVCTCDCTAWSFRSRAEIFSRCSLSDANVVDIKGAKSAASSVDSSAGIIKKALAGISGGAKGAWNSIGLFGKIGIGVAAVATAYGVISKIEQNARENLQTSFDNAMSTASERSNVYDLYKAYEAANEAYDGSISSKEALEAATLSLAEALGIEKDAIDGVKDSLHEKTGEELSAAVDDAEQAIIAANQKIAGAVTGGSTSWSTANNKGYIKQFAQILMVEDDEDSYLKANPPGTGADGKDGITPTIGENGNWYLGSTDTGKPSRGADGTKGDKGDPGAKGDKGDNAYVWIRYAAQKPTAASHSFGVLPDNWMGVYSGNSATAPTDWTKYQWFEITGAVSTVSVSATLTVAGWSASAPYTQSVTVSGLTDAKRAMAYPVYGSNTATNLALKEACGMVSFASRSGSTLTFTCLEDKPTVNIPITVEVYV